MGTAFKSEAEAAAEEEWQPNLPRPPPPPPPPRHEERQEEGREGRQGERQGKSCTAHRG